MNDEPGVMLPGHCFTIEVRFHCCKHPPNTAENNTKPCIIEGKDPSGWIFPDGWTASTEVSSHMMHPTTSVDLLQNCARSAQAEHMVLITETGCDVLTR